MAGTSHDVADGTLRDGAEASSRDVVDGFWSKGRLLPPVFGPAARGSRVACWFSGSESPSGGSFAIRLGEFGCLTEVNTTERGIELLIGELQATLVRARIAREQAT